jgi:hypothetical protein
VDGPHDNEALVSVKAVTVRLTGAVGGVRSRVWAERCDGLQNNAIKTTRAANERGDLGGIVGPHVKLKNAGAMDANVSGHAVASGVPTFAPPFIKIRAFPAER